MAKVSDNPGQSSTPDALAAAVARAHWLMLISAVTTAIAIAAVIGVIGYRVFSSHGSVAGTIVNGTIFLPKDAHVVATTISNGRIFVTLDIAGANEVRVFDIKTLQQVGDLRFATEH